MNTRHKQMPRRMAQALAAIVWLAEWNKSQTPNIATLGSLLITRPWHRIKVKNLDGKGWHWGWELDTNPLRQQKKVARHWLDFFATPMGTYFFDEVGPESYHQFINRKELVVDQDEAITILALHRASETNGGEASLADIITALATKPQTRLRPVDFPFLQAALDAITIKGYVRKLGNYYFCKSKVEYQLPYLRIVARNFKRGRR
ncbi:MAG: hypothetical protein AAB779_04225 [Patescibacteria group bacterium]